MLSLDSIEHRWNNVEHVEFKDLIEVAQLSQRQAAIAIARVDRFHNLFLEASRRIEELEAENAKLRSIIRGKEDIEINLPENNYQNMNSRMQEIESSDINGDILHISEEDIALDIPNGIFQTPTSEKEFPYTNGFSAKNQTPFDEVELSRHGKSFSDSLTRHETASVYSEVTDAFQAGSQKDLIASGVAASLNINRIEVDEELQDLFSSHCSSSIARVAETKELVNEILTFLLPLAITATLGSSNIQRDIATVVPAASLRVVIRKCGLADGVKLKLCDVDIILSRAQKGQKQLNLANAAGALVTCAVKRCKKMGARDLCMRLTRQLRNVKETKKAIQEKQEQVSPLDEVIELTKQDAHSVQFVLEKEFPALRAIYESYTTKYADRSSSVKGLTLEATWNFAKDFDLCPQFVSKSQVRELFQSVVDMVIEQDPQAQGNEPCLEFFQFEIWLVQLATRCPLFYGLSMGALSQVSPSPGKKTDNTPTSPGNNKHLPASVRLFHLLKCVDQSRGKLSQSSLKSRTSKIVGFKLNYRDKLVAKPTVSLRKH